MQDVQVPFTWADLGVAGLNWESFCVLVPPKVTAESIPDLDHANGPKASEPMPRRTLECLRSQLDTIAVLWDSKIAEEATKAEMRAQAEAFAVQILDQAKRIAEKKRGAQTADGAPAPKCPAIIEGTQAQVP